jgi:hypothetical protein
MAYLLNEVPDGFGKTIGYFQIQKTYCKVINDFFLDAWAAGLVYTGNLYLQPLA